MDSVWHIRGSGERVWCTGRFGRPGIMDLGNHLGIIVSSNFERDTGNSFPKESTWSDWMFFDRGGCLARWPRGWYWSCCWSTVIPVS